VLFCLASQWTRSLALLKRLRYPLKKGLSHGVTVTNLLGMHSRATLSKVSVKPRDETSISSLLKHSFQLHSLNFLRKRWKSANHQTLVCFGTLYIELDFNSYSVMVVIRYRTCRCDITYHVLTVSDNLI